VGIPTAVIWGVKDEYAEGGRMMCELCDGRTREYYVHSGGHEIPRGRKDVEGMVGVVKNAIGKASVAFRVS